MPLGGRRRGRDRGQGGTARGGGGDVSREPAVAANLVLDLVERPIVVRLPALALPVGVVCEEYVYGREDAEYDAGHDDDDEHGGFHGCDIGGDVPVMGEGIGMVVKRCLGEEGVSVKKIDMPGWMYEICAPTKVDEITIYRHKYSV